MDQEAVPIPQQQSPLSIQSVMPKDPFSFVMMLPFMPLFMMYSSYMSMMQQFASMQMPMQSTSQSRTKVTSIQRTGNTLDIIEKWV